LYFDGKTGYNEAMDGIVEFIGSVNKISLIAFIGVFGLLVYEILLLLRERKNKVKPVIPHFNAQDVASAAPIKTAVSVLPRQTNVPAKKNSHLVLILLLIGMLVVLLGSFIYMFFLKKAEKPAPVDQKIVIQEISSPGLKVYLFDWTEVTEKNASKIKPGATLFIGIHTIEEADIDKARIRVNEQNWAIKHITSAYKSEKKVYYIEHTVASGEAQLKIDAQLHSRSDGWLGD